MRTATEITAPLGTLQTISVVEIMAAYGWDAIYELNSEGGIASVYSIGVWTGPNKDILALKECATVANAGLWLSPAGETIIGAVTVAVQAYGKLKRLMPNQAAEWEKKMGLRLC